VLSYEESLNNLYYIALTQQNFQGATSSASQAIKLNEQLKFLPVTASGQSTQGGANDRTLEPAANAADQLYSPSDLKEGNLVIVGDPAWLQQGEAFVALDRNNPNYFKPFLADGTINFDAQQILFEIAFNSPRDYSLPTGLAQPSADRLNSLTQLDTEIRTPLNAQFSRVYIAKECTSVFEGGKFTQNLKGVLMTYYPPGSREGRAPPEVTASATAQAAPNVSAAPTVTIGNQTFPVQVPALNPANRPLLNVERRPLPPNLQPSAPLPTATSLPTPVSGSPLDPRNRPLLNVNPNNPQRIVKEP
jgi:hypothetical protein